MYMKVLVSLAVSCLLAGCVTPQATWRKAGVSADDAHSALAQCKYDVGLNKVDEAKEKTLVESCMEAKGFRWRTY